MTIDLSLAVAQADTKCDDLVVKSQQEKCGV